MSEEWRSVVGHEGFYEVSDHGQVRSLTRFVDTRPGVPTRMWGVTLKPQVEKRGHLRVLLYRDGVKRSVWVHRLVAEAFIGPRPDGLWVRHLDGDPSNNAPANLAYGTHSENVLDSVAHGTHNSARKTHCKHGHEFSPSNTRIDGRGSRECIECRRIRNLAVTARRRAARFQVAA